MTLLEIMLVLGLMGLLLVLGSYTVRAVTKSALRADTSEVAAALKAARNLAAESGIHHRVVLDLDQQTYRVEACPDPVQMKREDSEESKPDQEALTRLAEQPNPLAGPATGLAGAAGASPLGGLGALAGMGGVGLGAALGEVTDASSPEAALKAAAAIAGVRVGTARCGVASASGGDLSNFEDKQAPNVHRLGGASGISIRRVHVAHLRDPVTTGEVSVHFFPLGQSEKALIEVADKEGDHFTVLLHGLTGRVEVRDGEIDPDKHMRRDAAGDSVEGR